MDCSGIQSRNLTTATATHRTPTTAGVKIKAGVSRGMPGVWRINTPLC